MIHGKRKAGTIGLVAGLAISLAGAAFAADLKLPKDISWTAYESGSSGYAQSVGIGNMLKKRYEVDLRIIPGKNDVSRMTPLRLGQSKLCACGIAAYFAQEGVLMFAEKSWGPQPLYNLFNNNGRNGQQAAVSGASGIKVPADLKGKRIFTFPTAGKFLSRFGVVPVTLPWEDVEVAMQTGELDGIAWSGITEDYTVGWADVTNYFLTNNISGAWCGSYFANEAKWNAVPEHLKTLFKLCMDSSNYYRQHWYWGGEADLRVNGSKLQLTTIPEAEWATVEQEAMKFWDEIAKTSPRCAKVVDIFKQYNALMAKARTPYRCG